MKLLSVKGLNKALLPAACFLALSGTASAVSTVTVDGILSAGEYAGGSSSGQRSLLWYNGHNSIYTEAAGNMNPLLWEINGTGTGSNYSLNMFFEVPTYARRMIWDNSINYNGTYNPAWDIPKVYLDAYLDGTHHGSVNMSYGTQTGSEFFELIGIGTKIGFQDVDGNGLGDGFTWKTSFEYLIGNGLADTTQSLHFDSTASIELMWTGLTEDQAIAKRDGVEKMHLHLSDEARGLPSINVPESGSSLLLLGMGLVGLMAYRKQRAS